MPFLNHQAQGIKENISFVDFKIQSTRGNIIILIFYLTTSEELAGPNISQSIF
jgi:hypothetical protein